MSEFIFKNIKIYLVNLEDEIYEILVNELLFFGFDLDKDCV